MATLNQLCKKKRIQKKKLNRTPSLQKCPQKKGICMKFVIIAPKKPNSARRKVVKLVLTSTKKNIFAYIPGEGEQSLQKYSTILIRGGHVRDVPGMKYKLIRGKLDFPGMKNRITSRSQYGTKKITNFE
jgi:small subunit ribosomal protein S12